MKKETFAKRLEKALYIRDISKSELSKKLNIPKSAISHYISGKYNARQQRVSALADFLNVNEAWLIGLDVPMDKSQNKINGSVINSAIAQGENANANITTHVYHEMTAQAQELLNIFESLNIEGQSRLMIYAYDLKKEYLKSEAKD